MQLHSRLPELGALLFIPLLSKRPQELAAEFRNGNSLGVLIYLGMSELQGGERSSQLRLAKTCIQKATTKFSFTQVSSISLNLSH